MVVSESGVYKALFVGTKKDETVAYAFSIIGFDFIIIDDDEKIVDTLEEVLGKGEKYAIVVMSERFVEATRNFRDKLREKAMFIPAFLFIPDISKPEFKQLDELEELLQRALGITLKISEE